MATPTNLPASFTTGAVLTAAQMNDVRGSFRILRVASTQVNTTSSTSSGTFVDVSGMSVTIAPQSSTNKVLVIASGNVGFGGSVDDCGFRLVRDSTAIDVGTGATTANMTTFQRGNSYGSQTLQITPFTMCFLDSPGSVSTLTYKLQWYTRVDTIYFNRRGFDSTMVTSSTITVMEVSA